MKGLILSGGHGTRLRPITYSQQKQLIPVANKPILFYAIEDVIEAGAREIGIIVGPNKEQVIEAVKSGNWDADIEFIYQAEPKGLAHTILVAEDFLDDEFVMYLGDNILREGIVEHARKFRENKHDASIMLTEVRNPEQFGIAELNEDGTIMRLVEKPKEPPSNLALVGIYFFKPCIIDACKSIKPSWRNELEITDAIQWLIDYGYKVGWTKVSAWWKDTGQPEDILEANRLILDDLTSELRGDIRGELRGRVRIDTGTVVTEKSVIKGPAIIGRNCLIKDSYIGPYTSIGDNCEIINAEVEDSVVMDGAKLLHAGKVIDSMVGRGAVIEKNKYPPQGGKYIIGEFSWVRL
jgi:glucose-1-phosphate thymidylyltransferase